VKRGLAFAVLAGLALLMLVAGCTNKVTNPQPNQYFVFSFETTQDGPLQGWVPYAADIDAQHYTVTRTLDMARDSISSVKFYLDDVGGKGKIWIQRAFAVDTSTDYQVMVQYQFATRDIGTADLWTLIAGARPYLVEAAGELLYQGNTANGYNSDVGQVWLGKSCTFEVQSNSRGQIFVQIGVRGNGEGSRTYYLDYVYIIFTKK
jgi:hypothetical protein